LPVDTRQFPRSFGVALTTVLAAAHAAAGARMTTFAGWQLPAQYASSLQEHRAVRTGAGMFDVSHMTITDIAGPGALDALRLLLCSDVTGLRAGMGRYTCLLTENAGIIDDLIVYRMHGADGGRFYRLISNAGTRAEVRNWLRTQAAAFDVVLSPQDGFSMLAVQGPEAALRAAPVLAGQLGVDAASLVRQKRFEAVATSDAFVARTGYTGEDGWEVCIEHAKAEALWSALVAAGVVPCGLAARDTLRLEAGMSLYGSDMDLTTRPDEVGLGWLVDMGDPAREFHGRQAMAESPEPQRCRVGVVLEVKGVPRAGCEVRIGKLAGVVTSGSFSPVLERGIALVRMSSPRRALPAAGTPASVVVRGRSLAARLVRPPFVDTGLSPAGTPAPADPSTNNT
jgi:aminomethyltransferase